MAIKISRQVRWKFVWAVFAALLLNQAVSSPVLATDYSTTGWVSGFTVTNSVATGNDGSLVITATWHHQAATLVASTGATASGSLKLTSRGPHFCDSALTIAPAQNTLTTPAGCSGSFQNTPAPIDTVSNGDMTTVWTIPANIVAGFNPSYPFFGLYYTWTDVNNTRYVISSPLASIGTGISIANGTVVAQSPAPEKYSGPEISTSFGDKAKPGASRTLEGKKLDTITSITVDGKAATFKANSDKELELTLPADLKPGTYDLVIMSSHGKLIQMNAIVIKGAPKLATFTIKNNGTKLDVVNHVELANISSMFGSDYKQIHCVVNGQDQSVAKALAAQVCKNFKAGDLAKASTTVTTKSTYQGSGYWVRVYVAG